jgi:hypothetical protein
MFSSFSFGKIIKTILPGFILTAAIIFLIEAIARWYGGAGGSLIAMIAAKELLATVTAVLVPVSLILGFLLNTGVWFCCNSTLRSQVDAQLSSTVFPDIRQKLMARMWDNISKELKAPDVAKRQFENPTRESLEYFYLPVISLDRFNYLWESYFSWYEFQINTAAALMPLMLGEFILLWVAVRPTHPELFLLSALTLLPLTLLLVVGLWYAAKRNLLEYRKNILLLIAGSLVFAGKNAGDENKPKPWWQIWF